MAPNTYLLTPKQEVFIRAIAAGEVPASAYASAYGERGRSRKQLTSMAHSLIRQPKLAPFLGAARLDYAAAMTAAMTEANTRAAEERGKRHETLLRELDLSRERVLRELVRIAFSDLREVARWDGETLTVKGDHELGEAQAAAIAEIYPGSHGLRVKLHDKLAALSTLGRIMGLFQEKKDAETEPTLHLNINIVPPEMGAEMDAAAQAEETREREMEA